MRELISGSLAGMGATVAFGGFTTEWYACALLWFSLVILIMRRERSDV